MTHTVSRTTPLTLPTRRPDRTPTTDLVRCQPATASNSAPAPNVPPPHGPVITLRPTVYDLLVSTDDTTWHAVAHVRTTTQRAVDTVQFPAQRAAYVAVRIVSAEQGRVPMLQELVDPG